MAAIKQFRSSMHGFNREDVVNYIEYLNNHHNTQIAQLNNQLQTALSRTADPAVQEKLDAALAKCEALEAQLSGSAPAAVPGDQELEAYRRAERAERMAQERARQIYDQANAVLAEATIKLQQAQALLAGQLEQYQASMAESQNLLQEAAAALAAIQPEE